MYFIVKMLHLQRTHIFSSAVSLICFSDLGSLKETPVTIFFVFFLLVGGFGFHLFANGVVSRRYPARRQL